jgi:ABC-type lipoprotein export system ATPase subunit
LPSWWVEGDALALPPFERLPCWLRRDLRKLRLEKVGFIFQTHNLLPFLDATENIAEAMELAGVPSRQARTRAEALLDYLGVGKRRHAMPGALSGGEAQRVAIARALANSPRIILADEPTAPLDSQRAGVVMDLLRRIAADQQAAVLVVTHDETIFNRFDRLLQFRDGRLEGEVEPSDILTGAQPRNQDIRSLRPNALRLNTRGSTMICEFRQSGGRFRPTEFRCVRPKANPDRCLQAAAIASVVLLLWTPAKADPPAVVVGYQPMVSTGLAAKQQFEAWFVFDKSPDPGVPGYAVPAGTKVRLIFPNAFTPQTGHPHLEGALPYGWPQGAVPATFSVTQDDPNPRIVDVRIEQAIPAGPPERPGLKAIHVPTGELNPAAPGNYPIGVQFIDAGSLSGTTQAVAHITAKPLPNVAAYNQLHQGKDEDWQRVAPGTDAPLPIDFLITLPDEARSTIALAPASGGGFSILRDGKPIGSISAKGAPVTLTPQPFGPGLSRLGVVEVRAKAGTTPGKAEIVAALKGGTRYVVNLLVEGQ